MARKSGQLISNGSRTWLVRVSLCRDPESGTRKYHDKTIRGSFREAPGDARVDSRKCSAWRDVLGKIYEESVISGENPQA